MKKIGWDRLFINNFIPRTATHAEQLYSYVGGYLDISNYFYLFNIIIEAFNNRLKVIFDYCEIFYPITVGQSIVYSIQGLEAPGGSSPGYVLSVISFLPFTIPFVVIIAFLFKQVSFRMNEKVNFALPQVTQTEVQKKQFLEHNDIKPEDFIEDPKSIMPHFLVPDHPLSKRLLEEDKLTKQLGFDKF